MHINANEREKGEERRKRDQGTEGETPLPHPRQMMCSENLKKNKKKGTWSGSQTQQPRTFWSPLANYVDHMVDIFFTFLLYECARVLHEGLHMSVLLYGSEKRIGLGLV